MTSDFFHDSHIRPVHEEGTFLDLPVTTGQLPSFLTGRYLRNGPNPAGPLRADQHWFLGQGMVHGLALEAGRVRWYRSRRVHAGRGRTAYVLRGPAANTNVIGHAGRTLALIEAGAPCVELTRELDSVGIYDFGGRVGGAYSAHPHRDPLTGDLHALSYHFGMGNQVQYSVVDPQGSVRSVERITVGGSPMVHDFSLTAGHVVIYDLPVVFDPTIATATAPRALRTAAGAAVGGLVGRVRIPEPILTRLPGSGAGFPYSWKSSYPARVGVLPRGRRDADVRWFDIPACYVFHAMNAYDEGSRIVLDVVVHPRMFDRSRLVPDEGAPTLQRWVVDLESGGGVSQEVLDDRPVEFPRIDERVTGGRHRFGYAVAYDDDGYPTGTMLKHDLVTGSAVTRDLGPGVNLGEFIFVPRADDAGEDDGVVMGLTFDRARGRSSFVVLDAAGLDPVATVELPVRVPAGFHGNWLPD